MDLIGDAPGTTEELLALGSDRLLVIERQLQDRLGERPGGTVRDLLTPPPRNGYTRGMGNLKSTASGQDISRVGDFATASSGGKTLFLSVGEPSGDQHAARLIRELRRYNPTLRFRGLGGPSMRQAGCHIDHDMTQMAVVGLVEVLPKLRQFFRLADAAEEIFRSGAVDGVLLVDFPGFNWHIAKRAKRYGLPVHYYLPPQLWAWGGWRVRKMRRSVDHVMSVLKLEQQWYDDHGVANSYVGHPFFDAVAEQPLDEKLLDRLDARKTAGDTLVAVLPGSRNHEVQKNFPLMLEAIRRLSATHPHVRFLVGAFRDSHALWCRSQLTAADRQLPIDIFVGRTSEVIEASRCAMMVSGSVSLELLARGKPAAVLYRVGRILHTYARLMVRVKSITLVNLMAGRTLFPEMVSVGRPQPAIDFLCRSVTSMLDDDYYYQSLTTQLAELQASQGGSGATARAADVLLSQLGWTGPERYSLPAPSSSARLSRSQAA